MYKLIYFLILNYSTEKIFIRNKALPICSNCLHFIEDTNNYPYGRCNKFGEVDMVTGTIKYDLASSCRLNDSKCGKFGSEFTEKIKS